MGRSDSFLLPSDVEPRVFEVEVGEATNPEERVLQSVAMQLMNEPQVTIDDKKLRIKRVGSGRLRMVQFTLNGRQFEAIEQNRDKPSRWGQLAREKHQVVQFRDVETHKYVAVAVDGEITEYGRG